MVKEALMVITSAWSLAFIVLFCVFVSSPAPIAPDFKEARALIILVFLLGAVSGGGWLKFRHEMKKSRKSTASAT